MMGGASASWSSSQQEVVALYNAEAKYVSLCSVAKAAIWLRRLCSGITDAIGLHVEEPIKLMIEATNVYVEKQGCINPAPGMKLSILKSGSGRVTNQPHQKAANWFKTKPNSQETKGTSGVPRSKTTYAPMLKPNVNRQCDWLLQSSI